MHIRKGDTVEVVAGDDSGSRGTVLSVDRKSGKVVVEGINKVYKHVRRGHPEEPSGRSAAHRTGCGCIQCDADLPRDQQADSRGREGQRRRAAKNWWPRRAVLACVSCHQPRRPNWPLLKTDR